MFTDLKDTKDWRLWRENHVLRGEDRQTFISRTNQLVYECRMLPGRVFMKIFYTAPPGPGDGRFMREGMREKGDGRSFDLSTTPGEEKRMRAVCEKCGSRWTERIRLADKQLTFLDKAPVAQISLDLDANRRPKALLFSFCDRCEPEKVAQIRKSAAEAKEKQSPPSEVDAKKS
jgi:hypothetical protein